MNSLVDALRAFNKASIQNLSNPRMDYSKFTEALACSGFYRNAVVDAFSIAAKYETVPDFIAYHPKLFREMKPGVQKLVQDLRLRLCEDIALPVDSFFVGNEQALLDGAPRGVWLSCCRAILV